MTTIRRLSIPRWSVDRWGQWYYVAYIATHHLISEPDGLGPDVEHGHDVRQLVAAKRTRRGAERAARRELRRRLMVDRDHD